MLPKGCDHRWKSSTTSTWRFRRSPPSASTSTPSSSRTRPGCCCVSAAAAAGQVEQPRAAQARPDPDLSRPAAGEVIEPTALTSLDGSVVAVSGPGNARLQFRWFAGCPICSQHLGTFTARHGDVAAAGYHRGCGPPLCCRTAAGLSGRITVHRGRRSRPGALPTVRGGDRCAGDGRHARSVSKTAPPTSGCPRPFSSTRTSR